MTDTTKPRGRPWTETAIELTKQAGKTLFFGILSGLGFATGYKLVMGRHTKTDGASITKGRTEKLPTGETVYRS